MKKEALLFLKREVDILSKYICIHGHFYQPPRENPWLEEIELQDSAYPFHDWNEKITEECYAPNAFSRIKNDEGKIINIVNNYSWISFNFGPTLLSWMEKRRPEIYKAIIKADEISMANFSGHGNAIAQVYNHMIMPLANKRDKITQVRWGIEDFKKRFQRMPEGMWLPETAVDIETLEVLSSQGIKFTILDPSQAKRIKHIEEGEWQDVSNNEIDPKKPYFCKLPSGESICIFFYDGVTSKELAFDDLLNNGDSFAQRLQAGFTKNQSPEIVHIATDGETYGHHRSFADMTLAYCINHLLKNENVKLTNYGEFLKNHPPEHEVEIKENTSWSCAHGVKRWWTNCGCNSGLRPEWQQQWREPLRNAMDWLRDNLAVLYEKEVYKYFNDVWEVRNEYIYIIHDRGMENIDKFFEKHSPSELSQEDKKQALKLLEMQRYSLLMYTSCGWFFDEISGIETVQVIQYAARAIQIAQEITDEDYESEFVRLLQNAPSNFMSSGEEVYKRFVKPAFVDLQKIAAHYAISSLFSKEEKKEEHKVFSYLVTDESYETFFAGKFKMVVGKSKIVSELTWEELTFEFSVLWLGDHNIVGGVKVFHNNEEFKAIKNDIKESFSGADIQQVIKIINDHFGKDIYSLRCLFKDEQRAIINHILSESVKKAESLYREIFEDNYTVSTFLHEIGASNLNPLQLAAEVVINADIQKFLKSEINDLDVLKELVEDIRKFSVNLDEELISVEASSKISYEIREFFNNPDDINKLNWIISLVELIYKLPVSLNLWESQNYVFSEGKEIYKTKLKKTEEDDEASVWVHSFNRLCELLEVSFENEK